MLRTLPVLKCLEKAKQSHSLKRKKTITIYTRGSLGVTFTSKKAEHISMQWPWRYSPYRNLFIINFFLVQCQHLVFAQTMYINFGGFLWLQDTTFEYVLVKGNHVINFLAGRPRFWWPYIYFHAFRELIVHHVFTSGYSRSHKSCVTLAPSKAEEIHSSKYFDWWSLTYYDAFVNTATHYIPFQHRSLCFWKPWSLAKCCRNLQKRKRCHVLQAVILLCLD